ncbi:hypothetical protein BAY61_26345 [Prauserella marina]|uniref:Outer membrane lipoprotein-sorting protein n=1 Tax=Prauserella marina TaxID=530584 RepID=A0A222VVL4_9PSEU|nr:outer membrane lipoprotein carrier protein LolA [Prauserella marina]ASR37945.1 hypothetical protein BAY61_26345 [Prauserella marina]PWV73159.1 outer membrane lipoprotein-sorting protein [Prauserella marina]SDD70472.1 Outer membrane lipoprotein-sorting protein [Prauserella marina]
MTTKKRAAAVAVTGTALGAVGLGFLAMPAGAGEAPQLPPIGAEELVQSVLDQSPSALAGTVRIDNNLGLPAMPGTGMLDFDAAQIHYDGKGDSRISIAQRSAETTIVRDGETLWTYESGSNSATKFTLPTELTHHDKGTQRPEGSEGTEGQFADPATAAASLVSAVQETSTVAVDGTARVADRPAYELVLTPKPGERTLLREVRVAVDSETRLPLRLSVLTNGTTDPALEIGFSDISFGDQPADLFRFTPPQGAKVTERQPDVGHSAPAEEPDGRFVGEGWDTVYVGKAPAEVLNNERQQDSENPEADLGSLLDRIGTPVNGEFGSGHVVSTKVGTALITDDGRFAIGAVPQQVLIEALENK